MNLKKMLQALVIAALSARVPRVGRTIDQYGKYAVPLVRAHRFYERNRKAGMSKSHALQRAAADAGVTELMLGHFLADKTADFGEDSLGAVLDNKTSFH